MADVVVVGSLNMDLVATVRRFPRSGETVASTKFETIPGGKGANQAAAVARLGQPVALVGRVGQDEYGRALLENLDSQGVSTEHVRRDHDLPTGVAIITVEQGGENQIVIAAGANGQVGEEDIEAVGPLIDGAKVLIAQLELPLATVQAAMNRGRNAVKILNAAPAFSRAETARIIAACDVLVVNESEAQILSETAVETVEQASDAGEILRELGPQAVVVTMGERGAVLVSEGLREVVPAPKMKVVDTTAAGDAFVGALAVSVLEGEGPEGAVRNAVFAGSLAVTKRGAQPSLPTAEEFEAFKSSQMA